jgi:cytochrome c-type biogenesis protein CcmF
VQEGDTRYRLYPEKRRYFSGGNVMTEAAIRAGFLRDVYVALGEPLPGGAWALRVHYKPFVRWVWFGGLLMAFGGVLAICDARYRRLRIRDAVALEAGSRA